MKKNFSTNNLVDAQVSVKGIPTVKKLSEAASYFGLSDYTVRRWVNEGHLPCIRAGRKIYINLEIMAQFLQGSCLPHEPEAPTTKYSAYVPATSSKGTKMPPIF